jgi:hypothetical protein
LRITARMDGQPVRKAVTMAAVEMTPMSALKAWSP